MSETINDEPIGVDYQFDEDTLFGSIDWQGQDEHYNLEQSQDNFLRLIGEALHRTLSEHQITIGSGVISVIAPNTYVSGEELMLEIEQVFDDVYESYEWVVTERLLPINDASVELAVPVRLLEWAVEEEYIEICQIEGQESSFSETTLLSFIERVTRNDEEGVYLVQSNKARQDSHVTLESEISTSLKSLEVVAIFIEDANREDSPALLLPSSEHFLTVSSRNGKIDICFQHSQLESDWVTSWSHGAYFGEFVNQAASNERVASRYFDGEILRVEFQFTSAELKTLKDYVNQSVNFLNEIVIETENRLAGGFHWRQEYETNEDLFCRSVLKPLLKHMGFLHVKYTHGPQEFGKDFTFSEVTPFETYRYYGLQAKAGDLNGSATSKIHEIVNQANLAFSHPYDSLDDLHNKRHISTFIIAISGQFRGNATQIILNTVQLHNKGSIHFIDQETILNLIDKYWPKS